MGLYVHFYQLKSTQEPDEPKVLAFNGSPRKDGNTTILINHIFRELEKEGLETELVHLSGKKIHGCIACNNPSLTLPCG
jgi:multimeric flavodoxin WrbA